MDAVHLHLALNHVPVLGTVFAAIALGVAWWRRNPEFVRLSLWGVVLLCAVSVAIKFTGDFAWDELRPWPQPYDGPRVERHEQAADRATTAVFVTGLVAGAALWVGRKRPAVPGGMTAAVMVLLFGTFGLMAWTANLGGQLRHPQLRGDNAGPASPNSR